MFPLHHVQHCPSRGPARRLSCRSEQALEAILGTLASPEAAEQISCLFLENRDHGSGCPSQRKTLPGKASRYAMRILDGALAMLRAERHFFY